ncbi:MAG: chemotaxis response regulator protein-glutamate methylesterase [Alphaproteobacteria bacterium]
MTAAGSASLGRLDSEDAPIRVMIVDDSAVIRGMIARILAAEPRIRVASSMPNGRAALEQLERDPVDVVILDIEMPVMTGLEALPLIVKAVPGIKVIMASTLTRRGAAVSLEALRKGAADFVPKPTSKSEVGSSQEFARELIGKVLALGGGGEHRASPSNRAAAADGRLATLPTAPAKRPGLYGGAPIVLRQASRERPGVLAIGSSTGGPQALFALLDGLKGIRLPVLLTQHMPPHFTALLAEHLSKLSGMAAHEAVDGEPLLGARIYVAPGDYHMIVEQEAGKAVLRTTKAPPENFCRPSVDPMLRSVARCFGARSLVLILTGMGHDGLSGSHEIVRAGGTVVAQDEASSVVWGMPGAVASNGLCSAVLPLGRIASHLRALIGEG